MEKGASGQEAAAVFENYIAGDVEGSDGMVDDIDELQAGRNFGITLAEMDQHAEEHNLLDEFFAEVRKLVDSKARDKGYNESGANGNNPLLDFTEQFFPGHAGGEIVYKLVRYQAKGNLEDLFKAAAWSYLLYKRARTKAY